MSTFCVFPVFPRGNVVSRVSSWEWESIRCDDASSFSILLQLASHTPSPSPTTHTHIHTHIYKHAHTHAYVHTLPVYFVYIYTYIKNTYTHAHLNTSTVFSYDLGKAESDERIKKGPRGEEEGPPRPPGQAGGTSAAAVWRAAGTKVRRMSMVSGGRWAGHLRKHVS